MTIGVGVSNLSAKGSEGIEVVVTCEQGFKQNNCMLAREKPLL